MNRKSIPLMAITLVASGDVGKNRLVGFDGANATSRGQKVMGSSAFNVASGQVVAVATNGTAIVETGSLFQWGPVFHEFGTFSYKSTYREMSRTQKTDYTFQPPPSVAPHMAHRSTHPQSLVLARWKPKFIGKKMVRI